MEIVTRQIAVEVHGTRPLSTQRRAPWDGSYGSFLVAMSLLGVKLDDQVSIEMGIGAYGQGWLVRDDVNGEVEVREDRF